MIKDRIYKTVERRLYTLDALREATVDARADMEAKRVGMQGGGGHAFVSDPTAATAIKHFTPVRSVLISDGRGNIEEVRRPETWLYVIDGALSQLEDFKRNVIEARYKKKHRVIKVSMENPVGERTVYDWCRDFVHEVSLWAVAYGLVKVKDGKHETL